MKTRLLIIIGIVVVSVVVGFASIFYSQDIMMSTGMMVTTDCKPDEIKHNDQCIKLEVPSHIGTLNHGIDSIV